MRIRRRGFTTAEVLVVTGILAAIGGEGFPNVTEKAHQVSCFNQLRQMYLAFQMMANADEPMPQAWFYPPDGHPAREQYNLVNIMARNGIPRQFFICPAAAEEIKQRGMCYVYNDRLSNRNLDGLQDPANTWILMDVNGTTDVVPPAHHGGCNVLYGDGHVKWVPSSQIPKIVTQAVDYRGE